MLDTLLYHLSHLEIIIFIENIVVGYFVYKVVCCFVAPRAPRWLRCLAVFCLGIIANIVIFNEDPINVTYAMVGFFLVLFLGFQGSPWVKFSVVLVLYPMMTAWNFIYFDLGMRFYFSHEANGFLNASYRVLGLFLYILFWYGVYRLAKKWIPGAIAYLDSRTWLLVDIICMSPFLSVIIAVIITPSGREWGAYIIGLGSIVTSLAVFFLLNSFAVKIRSEAEVGNLRLCNSYYRELEANQEEIRRLRHDMRNHLGILGGLLENAETDEAQAYLKEFTDVTTATVCTYCENSVVNAVINAKRRFGESRGVACDFRVDIGSVLSIDSVDLGTIFANTLDNAIEAAAAAPNPKVEMKARYADGYFSYQVSNGKAQPVTEADGKFMTAKKDKKNHGFGLETVKNIVEKYDGTIDISYDETMFTVVVIIRL